MYPMNHKPTLYVGIDPRPPHTRILVRSPSGETLLKARLMRHPRHPRALIALLEVGSLARDSSPRCARCGRRGTLVRHGPLRHRVNRPGLHAPVPD